MEDSGKRGMVGDIDIYIIIYFRHCVIVKKCTNLTNIEGRARARSTQQTNAKKLAQLRTN